MATVYSDLIAKRLRHRGEYSGKEQNVSARFRVAAGGAYGTSDLLQMVPLGENVRPIRITILSKVVSGTPVLTNPTFSIGVVPAQVSNLDRPTGQSFPPLATNATVLQASVTMATDGMTTVTELTPPSANAKWGPYIVTLTPTAAFSVAGGDIDIILEVTFLGEQQDTAAIYSEFNSGKYKN